MVYDPRRSRSGLRIFDCGINNSLLANPTGIVIISQTARRQEFPTRRNGELTMVLFL
jgi:hypothetical protein